MIAGVGLGLACLIAGLVVALGPDGDDGPDRGPFEQAIIQLASTPVIRYETATDRAGGFTSDVRVTARGAALGTYSLAGKTLRTLTVDGKTYTRWDSVTGLTGIEDRWIAEDSSASVAPGATLAQTRPQTPAAFARSLLNQFNNKSTTLPAPGDPGTEIDGVPALKATMPTSDLYVAKEPPYRVLRVAPRTGRVGPSVPPVPSLSIPALPSLPSNLPTPSFSLPSLPPLPTLPAARPHAARPAAARDAPNAPAAAGAGTIDLAALPQAEIDDLFHEITDSVKELKNAVDNGIQFDLTGSADLKCSGGGCRVTARVTSKVSSRNPKGRITGGKVSATLNAQVQIEGRSAGGCTSAAELPLKGTSTISCYNTAAGPVFKSVEAQKKSAAKAQSRAQRGRPVPYTISGTAQATVMALAQVNVSVLLRQVDMDHRLSNPDRYGEGTGTGQRPTASAGPSSSPSPTASRPSPAPTPSPSEPSPDCSISRPSGATKLGGGWILNSSGNDKRTEAGQACLRHPLKKHPSSPSVKPVGHKEAVDKMTTVFNVNPSTELARCHIIPAALGGPNNKKDNLSPCWQWPTNVGPGSMRQFEARAQKDIEGHPDWTMLYTVEPLYRTGSSKIPELFVMHYQAYDSAGRLTSVDHTTVPNATYTPSGRLLNLAD